MSEPGTRLAFNVPYVFDALFGEHYALLAEWNSVRQSLLVLRDLADPEPKGDKLTSRDRLARIRRFADAVLKAADPWSAQARAVGVGEAAAVAVPGLAEDAEDDAEDEESTSIPSATCNNRLSLALLTALAKEYRIRGRICG